MENMLCMALSEVFVRCWHLQGAPVRAGGQLGNTAPLLQAEGWMWEGPAAVRCRRTHCQTGEPQTSLVHSRSGRIRRSKIVYKIKKTGYRQHREKGPLWTELRAGHPTELKGPAHLWGERGCLHLSRCENGSKEAFGRGNSCSSPLQFMSGQEREGTPGA